MRRVALDDGPRTRTSTKPRPDPKLLQPAIDLMMKYGKLSPFAPGDLLWTPGR
jgi:hypothetical protein